MDEVTEPRLHQFEGEAEWTKLDEAMDKSLLLKREPILMFAEIPLYESELDDNGSSQLCTKVGFPCLRGNQILSLGLTPVEPDEDSSAGVLYAANLRCFKRAHGELLHKTQFLQIDEALVL